MTAQSRYPVTLALIVAQPGPLRDSLQALLTTVPQIEIVAEAKEPSALLRLSDRIQPDIVLLDASLAESAAWAALAQIRERWPQARVIVLVESSLQQEQAEEAGADVALLKGFPAARLAVTIEELLCSRDAGSRRIEQENGDEPTQRPLWEHTS
jgi:DNA-binding NarL/FixJ family response regulator